jgi:creatinine amidohydrolase/Fe(II)-dependent formamide hydrolase-like protein
VPILPVGSNEQHGQHAPLGTDHFIAKALAEEAGNRTGVLCLQMIPFGVSFVHSARAAKPGALREKSPDATEGVPSYLEDAVITIRNAGTCGYFT